MRYGRTDEQKKQLAAGVIAAVRKATGEPLSDMVFVVREGVGVNFCEAGLHYAAGVISLNTPHPNPLPQGERESEIPAAMDTSNWSLL